MSTAGQEFDNLLADKSRRTCHPEDDHDDDKRSLDSTHSDAGADAEQDQRGRHRTSQNQPSNKITNSHNDDSPDFSDSDLEPPSSTPNYVVPSSLRPEANTGPKGVIADAQAYEAAKRSRRFPYFRSSKPPHDSPERARADISVDGSDDSSVDDRFLARWRQIRLRELKTLGTGPGGSHPGSASPRSSSATGRTKRRYGALTRSETPDAFLDAVERVPADTTVVVLVNDPDKTATARVRAALQDLAASWATTRFVELDWDDAEMERAGCPAVLAYRGGERWGEGLVPVAGEGGVLAEEHVDTQSVEALLLRHGILR